MPGRRIKPLQLHLLDGKSRLTAAEIERRQELEAELRIGTHDFKAPPEVRRDKVANKKWKEITQLYIDAEIEFVSTADTGILMQYCLAFSQLMYLIKARSEIMAKGWDTVKTYHAIDELGLENNINKKSDLVFKLGKSLYLDPQSRINTIKKKDRTQKSELEEMGFGNV